MHPLCHRVAKPSVEMADIVRLHSDAYIQANILTPEQHKVVNAIKIAEQAY